MAEHKLKTSDKVIPLTLPAIDGSTFELDSLKGKRYMLSFLRFATCPFCNLRVHELTKRYGELGGDFTIVAIFDSPLEHLREHAEGHHAPFPILADAENHYYREYGIEHSVGGVIRGMVLRMPTLIRGMLSGYLPTSIRGSITTMPADFLVDEEGVIQVAHYGRDEGDHLFFSRVRAFAQSRSGYLEQSVGG